MQAAHEALAGEQGALCRVQPDTDFRPLFPHADAFRNELRTKFSVTACRLRRPLNLRKDERIFHCRKEQAMGRLFRRDDKIFKQARQQVRPYYPRERRPLGARCAQKHEEEHRQHDEERKPGIPLPDLPVRLPFRRLKVLFHRLLHFQAVIVDFPRRLVVKPTLESSQSRKIYGRTGDQKYQTGDAQRNPERRKLRQ